MILVQHENIVSRKGSLGASNPRTRLCNRPPSLTNNVKRNFRHSAVKRIPRPEYLGTCSAHFPSDFRLRFSPHIDQGPTSNNSLQPSLFPRHPFCRPAPKRADVLGVSASPAESLAGLLVQRLFETGLGRGRPDQ